MNPLTSKYLTSLAFAALPFAAACDDAYDLAVADGGAGASSGATSDVLVVHVETCAVERVADAGRLEIAAVDVAREDLAAATDGVTAEP